MKVLLINGRLKKLLLVLVAVLLLLVAVYFAYVGIAMYHINKGLQEFGQMLMQMLRR